jgi:hypothetical protein
LERKASSPVKGSYKTKEFIREKRVLSGERSRLRNKELIRRKVPIQKGRIHSFGRSTLSSKNLVQKQRVQMEKTVHSEVKSLF